MFDFEQTVFKCKPPVDSRIVVADVSILSFLKIKLKYTNRMFQGTR